MMLPLLKGGARIHPPAKAGGTLRANLMEEGLGRVRRSLALRYVAMACALLRGLESALSAEGTVGKDVEGDVQITIDVMHDADGVAPGWPEWRQANGETRREAEFYLTEAAGLGLPMVSVDGWRVRLDLAEGSVAWGRVA